MLGKCSALSPAGNGAARNSQNPQGEQFHTGILTPLSGFCVSLDAFGEEPWSFPQGYTEVSEVSAAVCWGKMLPLTGSTTDTVRVFLVSLSLRVIWEGGRLWLHLAVQHWVTCCYRDSCIYQHTHHGLFKLPLFEENHSLHGIVRVWWLLQHLRKVKLNSIQVGGNFVVN